MRGNVLVWRCEKMKETERAKAVMPQVAEFQPLSFKKAAEEKIH